MISLKTKTLVSQYSLIRLRSNPPSKGIEKSKGNSKLIPK
jgi:hypothetical protein